MRRRRVRCRGYSPGPPSPTKEGCSAKVTMSGRSGSRRTVSLRTGNRPALSSGCGSAGLDPRVRLPIVLLLLLLLQLVQQSGGLHGLSNSGDDLPSGEGLEPPLAHQLQHPGGGDEGAGSEGDLEPPLGRPPLHDLPNGELVDGEVAELVPADAVVGELPLLGPPLHQRRRRSQDVSIGATLNQHLVDNPVDLLPSGRGLLRVAGRADPASGFAPVVEQDAVDRFPSWLLRRLEA